MTFHLIINFTIMLQENYEKEVNKLQERLQFEDIADALIKDVEKTLLEEKNNKEKESD